MSRKKKTSNKKKRFSQKNYDEIEDYLRTQPKDMLVKTIIEQLAEDHDLRAKLSIEASLGSAKVPGVEIYLRKIDELFDFEYIGPWKEWGFIMNLMSLKNQVDRLIDQGHYEEARNIVGHFLTAAKTKVPFVNMADGEYVRFIKTLYDSYASIFKGLHFSTEEIAAWVYAEINSDGYGFADELLEQMKDVLGPEGFKTIKQTAWSDFLHCPEPAGEETKYDFKKSRYKIILLEIARITHDDRLYLKTCEAVLDSGPHAYLELARKLDDLHLLDKAIARLYEGIERHPDDQNFSLREMLCRMLEKKGDIEKAFEIAHALLPEHPSLYPRIKILAQKLNTWDRTKQEIIEQFTEHDHLSELIGLYLAENQLAEAIAIAEKYEDAAPIVWETARLAEREYPNAAVSLYQRFVDYHIDLKTRTEYKEAAKIAAKIKELLIKNGQTSTWHEYIENLRTNNKRKKNLLRVLANL